MADGNLVRQSNVEKDSVVFGPTVYDVPLLPYEKQLIDAIGATEEEYRKFTAEAKRRGAVRPAAYDRIPDIRCEPATTTAILVNLAISLVLTGVAYLLTPKPKMPGSNKRGGIIDLGDITGANRFTPSRGFDTLAELADYASPIPLIFGLYREEEDIGGMLVTLKLVWSRMFSHGTLQRAKLMFIVGEQGVPGTGIAKPDLQGIYLGNNALDSIYKDFFTFYWKANSNVTQRILAGDRQYGTINEPASGDPEAVKGDDDVFTCPTFRGDQDKAFCQAYSPANNTQFGVYGAIANGTSYRLNYKIISIDEEAPGSSKKSLTITRVKIAGDLNYVRYKLGATKRIDDTTKDDLKEIRDQHQAGKGRNYSPRMGLVQHRSASGSVTKILKGTTIQGQTNNHGGSIDKKRETIKNIEVGDRLTFLISDSSIDEDFYKRGGRGETVDEINSTVEALQIEADASLQLGEKFEIGGCIWVVFKRKQPRFEPDSNVDQEIFLKCIDTSTSIGKKVGIVSKFAVVAPDHEYIGDSGEDVQQGIGEKFYPLTKVAIASVRNNRPAVSTEIGIKSMVYQRLNGLCAFNSLPSPTEIGEFDEDGFQVNNGTITASIVRSSFFRVFIKNASDDDENFVPFPYYFVIRGQRPVPQYNFIRFKNSEQTGARELEFKFVPISGSDVNSIPDNVVYELSQSTSTNSDNRLDSSLALVAKDMKNIGTITAVFNGRPIGDNQYSWKERIQLNKEFTRGERKLGRVDGQILPSVVEYNDELLEPQAGRVAKGFMTKRKNQSNATTTQGKLAAFFYEVAGDADNPDYILDREYKFLSFEYIDNDTSGWMHVKWTVQKKQLSSSLAAESGKTHGWRFKKVRILGSGIANKKDDEVQIRRGLHATNVIGKTAPAYSSSNPFRRPDGAGGEVMQWSGMLFKVDKETDEKVNPLPARRQAYRYYLFNNTNPENAIGETKTVEKIFNNQGRSIRLKITGQAHFNTSGYQSGVGIDDNNAFYSVGNKAHWRINSIEVVQGSDTSEGWEVGDTFKELHTPTNSNPFKTSYPKVGHQFIVKNVSDTGTAPLREAEETFITSSQVTDISQYRDFVEKSNLNQPEHEIVYVNEMQLNEQAPSYSNLTLAGLSLKASRNFTQLDQLRCWLASGMHVERLHPDKQRVYNDTNEVGPSNLFTDLVYFLLTDQVAGAGGLLAMNRDNPNLIEKDQLILTSRFLFKERMFFNGPIVERTNLRQFIMDVAPFFLCNFVIIDGKFSLKPALPIDQFGNVIEGAVPIGQFFTSGNILEDTFKVEYLSTEERRAFKAVVRFRQERKNSLPEEKAISVRATQDNRLFADAGVNVLPVEQFDLTQFCTSQEHAEKVAKYFLVLRALVTHTISFSTTLEGLSIQAGSFIKVSTESSPYSSANSGTINSSGVVTSVSDLPDGTYEVIYFKPGSDEVEDGTMFVAGGIVAETTFHDTVFTIKNDEVNTNTYVVEQLTFSDQGTVDIVASEYPCNDDGSSRIVEALLDGSFESE
jgi:hypothetical protein